MSQDTIYDQEGLQLVDRDSIRLLQLTCDHDDEVPASIKCSLVVVSMNNNPDYTAVSYRWGQPVSEHTIEVNERCFKVRLNLWNLLNQLKSEGHSGSLWIDAICINQEDDNEKCHQVKIMGQIFSGATAVIAWLGVATDTLARFIQSLPRLNNELNESRERGPQGWMPSLRHLEDVNSCFTFCSIDYWQRLWILQEFALAKVISIRVGAYTVAEHELRIEYLQSSHFAQLLGHASDPDSKQDYARRVVQTRKDYLTFGTRSKSLSSLVGMTRACKCDDIRDRIYGIVALVSPEELKNYPLEPDYTISVTDLITRLIERNFRLECDNASTLMDSDERGTDDISPSAAQLHSARHLTGVFSELLGDIFDLNEDGPIMNHIWQYVLTTDHLNEELYLRQKSR